ncbi:MULTISPECIES: hypothetical protein [Pseudomonas]|jgi:hypothetical protein|uniref:hypothetical protein n=1 Tax=Pseudomonas TaxID=286 RepID=UPI000B35B5BF|nr:MULTISPECIES: hypothetical protein [Pseudomonas]PMY44774.1 hypothetical protein C1X70_29875 [Pseudomonas sp. FW305-53]PMY88257.1 hypothetical protein C1X68_05600 [Pseudomonas sp. FW303-C2]PMY91575.1 hypothetical protein C1X67_17430 [Pseudomonas sp. FW305-62]PNA40862.1 hypothetical protein C1X71_21040 [Pseudomonas sp. FW306-2-2C-A10BC]PNA87622.1 hypothetical protein C1X66_08700 [Pseudomonas sp. MPR-R3B]
MNTWHDKTFGRTGIWIWLPGISPIVLLGVFIFLASPYYYLQDFIGGGILLGLPAAWGIFYISQVRTVLQEISLDDDRILGRLYFGRHIEIKAPDIKSISYYPMTWKIRQVNLFDRNKPGINIELHNGRILRINAKTEGFASLVETLKALAKASDQIFCSL